MKRSRLLSSIFIVAITSGLLFACGEAKKPPEKDIVKKPEQLREHTRENITDLLAYAGENDFRINDSVKLQAFPLLDRVYKNNSNQALWSRTGTWLPLADSLYAFIEGSRAYGLFRNDYYYDALTGIRRQIETDTVARKDAALWTRADILLTDAFFNLSKHLKEGRIKKDSLSQLADSLINDDFYIGYFYSAQNHKAITPVLEGLEPGYAGYRQIKAAIRKFLDSAHFVKYTVLPYPYKDSLLFVHALEKRLAEEGFFDPNAIGQKDSIELSTAIGNYQHAKGITKSGKITAALVSHLNENDWEKFRKIAITLDRYKLMPDPAFNTYVLVNIPAYMLSVYEEDTLVMQSKVIVGAPKTRTPLLQSEISNFITYPQWTVPYSIIFKEMLPKIQKNISFLEKQNLMVVDEADSVIDPYTIDWSVLSKKHFPYLLRQRQGDDNSLGVIKFNFRNKYSVYLHDTNARWLFSKSQRALSHGCVRVKDWNQLARFLIRDDTLRFPPDSLKAWIGRQEKHVVSGFRKVPLFIRYFTVEARNGELKFFEDIYGEDRELGMKYFERSVI